MATINGVAGTAINASVSVSDDDQLIDEAESATTAQSLANDLATIKSGTYTETANVAHGPGGSHVFHEDVQIASDGRLLTLGRRQKFQRVAVADANKVLGVGAHAGIDYVGQRFIIGHTGSPRVIKISKLFVPSEGETIEVFYVDGSPGGGTQLTFERDDATVICEFSVEVVGNPNGCCMSAEFEYVSGVWRLGANPGSFYSNTDSAARGVIPGAGA